jgi:type VI secretion system protein ImpM
MPGLFGKAPSSREFIRVNIGGFQVRAFDEWLRANVMALHSGRAPLPIDPVAFLFRALDAPGGLIGVMCRSEDGVGREFPLAVFESLDGRTHPRWTSLPLAYAGFIDAAIALLGRVATLELDQLSRELERLPRPSAVELEARHTLVLTELTAISADELLDRLFSRPTGDLEGERFVDDHLHGFGALVRACESTRAWTVELPISGDLELGFWLEFIQLASNSQEPPTLLWSRPQHRLVLAFGPAEPTLLGRFGVADPDLATSGSELLTVEQRAAIERPGQSAAELLHRLTRSARRP